MPSRAEGVLFEEIASFSSFMHFPHHFLTLCSGLRSSSASSPDGFGLEDGLGMVFGVIQGVISAFV